MLRHIALCVKNLGPLWVQSMFIFESKNGELLKMVNGTTDVLQQISTKYKMKFSAHVMNESERCDKDNRYIFKNPANIELSPSEINTMSENGILIDNPKEVLIYKSLIINNKTKITSLLYPILKRSIDYFILIEKNIFGKVNFFYKSIKDYVIVEEYEVKHKLDQILEVVID